MTYLSPTGQRTRPKVIGDREPQFAGELGGVLELVLNRLAEYQEKAQKLKNMGINSDKMIPEHLLGEEEEI